MIKDGYYYPDWIWSKKAEIDESTKLRIAFAVFLFIIGNRGSGKSVGVGLAILNDYIEKGYQCALIRRYDKDFEGTDTSMQSFWEKCYKFWEHKDEHQITFKSNTAYIDNKKFCYPIALNKVDNVKHLDFENVHTIIFDEFIPETKRYVQIKGMNELMIIFNILDTIARGRPKAKDTTSVIFISNTVTADNLYFNELGINKILRDNTKRIDREKEMGYVLEKVYNEEVAKETVESSFGKLLLNTKTGRNYLGYAQGNQFRDNKDFICGKIKGKQKYLFTFIYAGTQFSAKFSEDKNFWYLSESIDKTFPKRIALTKEDHSLNTSLINATYRETFKSFKKIYENGDLYFENLKLKHIWEEVYNKI